MKPSEEQLLWRDPDALFRCSMEERRHRMKLFWEEPFRIFFPLGLLLGAIGVALWPLYFWHLLAAYPSTPHMRLMIEGLMGSFVLGFLGTAGPRLLDAPPLGMVEVATLILLQLAIAGLHLARQQLLGDLLFLALLLLFLAILVRRIRRLQDLPPPSFLLVLGGFINAIAGIALLQSQRFWLYQLGSILLNEGFILFPILGVGAFFFPKLLVAQPAEPADLRIAAAMWKKGARLAALCLLALWISFLLEALAWTRSAALLRGLTSAWYLGIEGGLFTEARGRTFLAQCFQLGGVLLVAGLFMPLLFPDRRVANLHVVFLGGFSIILFTVSTRVILGHAGASHLFRQRLRFLITALAFLLLAMLARVSADFFPVERNSHLIYAALLWLLASAAWAWALGPRLSQSED